ncbi:hypothetical protein [Glutamicibacter sp. NPDC087344]|uniref:hypothetical protein n=1 Tax=Glutamicibacter sp. NPDC087344 TaxID=3363994 RepID=UPI003822A6EA
MNQSRFPIAVSDLAAWQDEASYLAQQPAVGINNDGTNSDDASKTAAVLDEAIRLHLDTAQKRLSGPRILPMLRSTLIGSVMAHVHAAETLMLRRGDTNYLIGKIPKIQADVRNHLRLKDPQRIEFEQLIRDLDKLDSNLQAKRELINSGHVREEIINAGAAANMAYRREYARMFSFHRGLTVWTLILLVLGVALAVWGAKDPGALAICFTPVGQESVVCPTGESPYPTVQTAPAAEETQDENTGTGSTQRTRDEVIKATAQAADISLLLLMGMAGAAVTAAASFRNVSGTAAPFNLAIAMALLKLPLGALTTVFGLILIRGGFFPGLSDLDSSPQILAWAVIFGAAQQLFTAMVDQQAKRVQDQVGEAVEAPAD